MHVNARSDMYFERGVNTRLCFDNIDTILLAEHCKSTKAVPHILHDGARKGELKLLECNVKLRNIAGVELTVSMARELPHYRT